MPKLIIPQLNQKIAHAAEIPAALQNAGIIPTTLDRVNWPEAFPYRPEVRFAAAHTGDTLLLLYCVEEQSVRAVARHDHEHIWEDACVEFFCMPAKDDIYYNVECNCTGKLLVAAGKDRSNRMPAPVDVMKSIDRWASLGTEPFDTRNEPTEWKLALRLPITSFFLHQFKTFDGMAMTGNVYKCGDSLPVPHFVSWSPVETPSPDFHRPDFFGEILFE